jgi:hypothetical protein
VNAIVDITGVSPAVAERALELYSGKKVLPRRGEIDLKGLAQVIAFMAETGQLKSPLPEPQRFVDLRYLKLAGIQ